MRCKMIFMTNLLDHSKMNSDKFLKWWYKNDPTHVSFYSRSTVEYLANELKMSYRMISDSVFILIDDNQMFVSIVLKKYLLILSREPHLKPFQFLVHEIINFSQIKY